MHHRKWCCVSFINSSGSILRPLKFLPNRNASNLLNPLTAFKTSSLLPTGVFSIQSEIDDSYIISPIKFVQDLTDKEYQVTHLEIKLIDNKKMFDTREIKKNYRKIILLKIDLSNKNFSIKY